ncbi:hypothetical protein D9M71_622100 [compost metagenome]
MLARQAVDGVQPLFQHLQPVGIGIEVVDEAVQFADRFLHLYLRAGQQVDRLGQRRRLALEGGQAVQAGGEH